MVIGYWRSSQTNLLEIANLIYLFNVFRINIGTLASICCDIWTNTCFWLGENNLNN